MKSRNTEIIHEEQIRDIEFLGQIKKEIKNSLDIVQRRREVFREDLKQYISQEVNDEIIGVNTLYSMVNLLQAVNLNDDLDIIAMPRSIGYDEYADNITANARWDMKEMEHNKKEFQRSWDSLMFGVGIIRKTGWDNEKSIPTTTVVDPTTWICDPNMDLQTKPRYTYQEIEIARDEITKENGYLVNGNEIESTIEELEYTKQKQQEASGLDNKEKEDDCIQCYDGLSYLDGELYFVTVDAGCNHFLRKEKVDLVTELEKKTKRVEIETIWNFKWFSPRRGSPFGVSLPDLMRDKQYANKVLLNLRMSNAKFATYGQMMLVNTEMVKDTKELAKPSINTKLVGVNPKSKDLSQVIYPVPRPQIGQDSYSVASEITKQIQLDTGLDSNTMGVGGMGVSQTLGEAQQIQANANLRMSLGIEIGNWAEQEFWEKIWYRSYLEFFGKKDKKIIRVAGNFSSSFIELDYNSFVGSSAIEFTIESKRKIKAIQEGMRANYMAKLPLLLQDPNTPEISKKIAQRYAYKLDGMSREMQYLLVPKSADELLAEEKVKFINENMEYGAEIESLNEDHMTYLVLFQSARNTRMKHIAIEKRIQAIIEQKQQQMMMQSLGVGGSPPTNGGSPTLNATASASAAQLTNSAISNNKDPISVNSL